MSTECGIPWIELQGTLEDWEELRLRADQLLANGVMPKFADAWRPGLIQILDEFVASYRGNVNHHFWQSICKKVQHGAGSGAYTTISGWITTLFPHIDDGRHLRPDWRMTMSKDGPEPDDFPEVISSAPVEWDYHGEKYPLHFHAGAFGLTQDPETGAIRAINGWAVTHDPPKEPAERLALLEKEIADIQAGIGGGEADYRTRYWLESARKEAAEIRSKLK